MITRYAKVLFGGILFAASAAFPATLTVTNTNDSGAGSLRQAIADANGLAGADTVDLSDIAGTTVTLASGEILINGPVTITGDLAAPPAISGNNASRIFFIKAAVSISDVNLIDGRVQGGAGAHSGTGGGGGGAAGMGGAIFTRADLALTRVMIRGSAAVGGTGGNSTTALTGSGGGGGGGAGGAGQNGGVAPCPSCGGFGGPQGNMTPSGGGGGGGNGSDFTQSDGGSGDPFGGAGGGGGGALTQPGRIGGGGGFGAGGGGGGSCISSLIPGGGAGQFGGAGGAGGLNGLKGTAGGGGGGAGLGGALFIQSGQTTITQCVFTSNAAIRGTGGSGKFAGGAGQGKGGAIFVHAGATLVDQFMTFSANAADDDANTLGDDDNIFGASIVPVGLSGAKID